MKGMIKSFLRSLINKIMKNGIKNPFDTEPEIDNEAEVMFDTETETKPRTDESGLYDSDCIRNSLTEAKAIWIKSQYEKDPIKKEEMLLLAEEKSLSSQNYVDLHFVFINLIEHYYRQRHTDASALDKCIEYCEKDIDLFPKFKEAYINEYLCQIRHVQSFYEKDSEEYRNYEIKAINCRPIIPNIPSFKRLAIIYEKQEKYEEAIKICDLAISFKLSDDTKGGFEGRRDRLLKKIKNREKFSIGGDHHKDQADRVPVDETVQNQ